MVVWIDVFCCLLNLVVLAFGVSSVALLGDFGGYYGLLPLVFVVWCCL